MSDPGYGQGQAYGEGQGQGYGAGQGQPYGAGAPDPMPTSGMPYPTQGGTDAKGFLASLFDTSFSSFVTPKVIKVVYVIIMIILALETLGYIIFGFAAFKALGIIFLPVAVLVGLVSLAVVRMGFELVMVIFRIGDDMRALRGNTR